MGVTRKKKVVLEFFFLSHFMLYLLLFHSLTILGREDREIGKTVWRNVLMFLVACKSWRTCGGAITTRLLSTQDGFVHCSPSPSLHLLGLPSEIGQQKSCLNQLAPSHVPNLHSCSWWISTPSFCPLRFPHFWWEPLSCGPFSQQLQLTRLSCWLRENSCPFLDGQLTLSARP